jgi:hypothetical protein
VVLVGVEPVRNYWCENDAMNKPSLSDVIASEAPRLMALPGVVGVAEGSDQGNPCVVVYVAGEHTRDIPSSFAGYGVVVRRSGEIKAQ